MTELPTPAYFALVFMLC